MSRITEVNHALRLRGERTTLRTRYARRTGGQAARREYTFGGIAAAWSSRSVDVTRSADLTVDQWLEAYFRLKANAAASGYRVSPEDFEGAREVFDIDEVGRRPRTVAKPASTRRAPSARARAPVSEPAPAPGKRRALAAFAAD